MARRQSKQMADDPGVEPGSDRERVTIRHAIFQYDDADGVARRARRGAVVEVGEPDLTRGKNAGAFVEHYERPTPDLMGGVYAGQVATELPIAPADPSDALTGYGDDALAVFVSENSPDDIAEAVVTARDAQRVLVAENAVTNNDPRTSLVQLMEAVIASTDAASANNEDEEPEDLSQTPDPGADGE
jgi:hypothetical protein